MYTPSFPYLGNQAIVSSGRVTIHSKDDFIFLFGKKGAAISSPTSFTVDAEEIAIIGAPRIELGYEAQQPVFLGRETATQLGRLLDAIKDVSDALNKLNAEQLESTIAPITTTTKVLSDLAMDVKTRLSTSCLSNQTFTN